ncbi:reverse transcriptase, partial [Tanacetum coccineum]
LPTEFDMGVRMFKHQTLADAYCLTNLQEATLNAVKKNNKVQFGTSSIFRSNGVLAEHNELKEEFVDAYEILEEMETEEFQPQISLNALSGVNSFQTLRVVGLFVNGQELHILVHSGSTYNFLDIQMAKRLGYKIMPTCPLSLTVAGGKRLLSWLSTLGDIKCNFKDLKMKFVYNNKKMAIRGSHKTSIQWVEGKSQLQKMGGTPQAEMFMLCVYPNSGLSLSVIVEQENEAALSPELL